LAPEKFKNPGSELQAVACFETGGFLMLVQVGLERERLSATCAPEVLGGRVGLQVRAQVAPVSEGLPAEGAGVRLVAGVRSFGAEQ
jgi:hypothetical protein